MRWSIPLMVTSGTLHWLISNCIYVSFYISKFIIWSLISPEIQQESRRHSRLSPISSLRSPRKRHGSSFLHQGHPYNPSHILRSVSRATNCLAIPSPGTHRPSSQRLSRHLGGIPLNPS